MKYEDFWSMYFTIWRILLIFYLTHSCIYLFNYHHLYYLSETDSLLPMFLLLILNYCCSDGIIVEASDVFGYRVWVLVYRVCQLNWLSASCQLIASCQIVLSASCWLLFILLVLFRYWFAVVVSRCIPSVSGMSICQCQNVSWLVKVFSPIYEIKWSSNITIKKK